MLTKKFECWAIETTVSEYSGFIQEYFDTYEDAVANIGRYSDWYCRKGTCTILKLEVVDGVLYITESIKFFDGNVEERRSFHGVKWGLDH